MKILRQLSVMPFVIAACFLFSNTTVAQELKLEEIGEVKEGVRHVNGVDAAKILEGMASVKVLDVRTGFEYDNGHLSEDAKNVNYYSLSFRKNLEKLDRKTIWLVHCHSGVRSGKTLPIMKELGFENIVHLDGGIQAWKAAGNPVIKE